MNCPEIYSLEAIEIWKLVTQAVYDRGSKIFL